MEPRTCTSQGMLLLLSTLCAKFCSVRVAVAEGMGSGGGGQFHRKRPSAAPGSE